MTMMELLNRAWGVIANVDNGDWTKQRPDWQTAAAEWREEYHKIPAGTGPIEVPADASPAVILAAIIDLQGRLDLDRGAELLLGPYTKCDKCKLWIHNNSPIKHTCIV